MKYEIPNQPNFYSSFVSPTKTEIKKLLEQNGWKIRKQSLDDFECSNDWAELNLVAYRTYTLLNGSIANPNKNFNILLDIFKAINCKFQMELYDENQNIVLENKNY